MFLSELKRTNMTTLNELTDVVHSLRDLRLIEVTAEDFEVAITPFGYQVLAQMRGIGTRS